MSKIKRDILLYSARIIRSLSIKRSTKETTVLKLRLSAIVAYRYVEKSVLEKDINEFATKREQFNDRQKHQ